MTCCIPLVFYFAVREIGESNKRQCVSTDILFVVVVLMKRVMSNGQLAWEHYFQEGLGQISSAMRRQFTAESE